MPPGGPRSSEPELELRDLHECERRRLGLACRGVEREPHGREGTDRIAGQLARVRDACVRGETGAKRDHPLEGGERLVVATELDERVADDAVRPT